MPKIEPKLNVTPSTLLVTGLTRALAPLGGSYEARGRDDHRISGQNMERPARCVA